MVKREYYPLKKAAEILGCGVDDLIHLAAKAKVRIHVLTGGWTRSRSNLVLPVECAVPYDYWLGVESGLTDSVTTVFKKSFNVRVLTDELNTTFSAPYHNCNGEEVTLNKFVILHEELEIIRLMPEFQRADNAPISSEPSNSDEVKHREVNAWLYETWLNEGSPTGAPFLKSLKKYVNLPIVYAVFS